MPRLRPCFGCAWFIWCSWGSPFASTYLFYFCLLFFFMPLVIRLSTAMPVWVRKDFLLLPRPLVWFYRLKVAVVSKHTWFSGQVIWPALWADLRPPCVWVKLFMNLLAGITVIVKNGHVYFSAIGWGSDIQGYYSLRCWLSQSRLHGRFYCVAGWPLYPRSTTNVLPCQ